MHIKVTDLDLEHLWVFYPGREEYAIAEKITAIPFDAITRFADLQ
jgi:hypothetical protein